MLKIVLVSRAARRMLLRSSRAAPPRFAWRAPRRAAASRQQGLTTLGKIVHVLDFTDIACACLGTPGFVVKNVDRGRAARQACACINFDIIKHCYVVI